MDKMALICPIRGQAKTGGNSFQDLLSKAARASDFPDHLRPDLRESGPEDLYVTSPPLPQSKNLLHSLPRLFARAISQSALQLCPCLTSTVPRSLPFLKGRIPSWPDEPFCAASPPLTRLSQPSARTNSAQPSLTYLPREKSKGEKKQLKPDPPLFSYSSNRQHREAKRPQLLRRKHRRSTYLQSTHPALVILACTSWRQTTGLHRSACIGKCLDRNWQRPGVLSMPSIRRRFNNILCLN